jgi:hypothetical protein
MTPTFSDAEYRRLMLLTFLGEWMLNAIRKDPDPAYEDLASKVYSLADGTLMQDLVVLNENSGNWIASDAFENDAQAMIDQYDEIIFWEELTSRLTERDLISTYGENAVGSMRPQERVRAGVPIAKAYTREFENEGINRLRVQDPTKNHGQRR